MSNRSYTTTFTLAPSMGDTRTCEWLDTATTVSVGLRVTLMLAMAMRTGALASSLPNAAELEEYTQEVHTTRQACVGDVYVAAARCQLVNTAPPPAVDAVFPTNVAFVVAVAAQSVWCCDSHTAPPLPLMARFAQNTTRWGLAARPVSGGEATLVNDGKVDGATGAERRRRPCMAMAPPWEPAVL